MNCKYTFFLLALIIILIPTTIQAQKTWDGGAATNNWMDDLNWNPDGVPAAGDDVIIIDGVTVTINGNATCNNLTVGQGTSGILQTDGGANRTFSVNGKMTIAAGAQFNLTRAIITVTDSTIIYGTITDNNNNGSNTFGGIVVVKPGGDFSTTANNGFEFQGGIHNDGTFDKGGTGLTILRNERYLSGNNEIRFSNGNVLITSDDTIFNNNATGVYIVGRLYGNNAGSTWRNEDNAVLEYCNATAPMTIGVFDVDQPGNTVIYNANGNQSIADFTHYNLICTIPTNTNRARYFTGTNITVLGDITIQGTATNNTYLRFRTDGVAQTLTVNGNVIINDSRAFFEVENAGTGAHQMNVGGQLINNGYLYFRRSTSRYADITFSGADTVIKGNGTYYARNLTFDNVGQKFINTTSQILLYEAPGTNAFTNNNGTLTALDGTIYFVGIDTFLINGSGDVIFYNLTSGNNNVNRLVLEKDIIVNGTLRLNHSNNPGAHIDLNSYNIYLNGDYQRVNSGIFRGNVNSSLFLGNGDAATVTGTLNFEAGYRQLDTLLINTPGATYTLGTADTIAEFILTAGTFNPAAYDVTVSGKSILDESFIDNNNAGTNTFQGHVTINNTGSLTTANTSPFIFEGGITNDGIFTKSGAGLTSFLATQTLDGANQIDITGGNVTIGSAAVVTNNNDSYIAIYGILNGADATSVWKNNDSTVLEYRSANAPMVTGVFDVDQPENIVYYNANANQYIADADHYHLVCRIPTAANRVRYFTGDTINILGNLTVEGGAANYTYLRFRNDGVQQYIHAHQDVTLTSNFSIFEVENVNTSAHELVIDGQLSNPGTINFRRSATRYADLKITSTDTIIEGNGTYYFRNIEFDNAGAKFLNSTSNIDVYGGAGTNAFTNSGGSFSALAGTMRFMDADTFLINGNGAVYFNNLTAGNNNANRLVAEKDLRVKGNLVVNHNNSNLSHLDLNGYSLYVDGDFTRSNSGDFRGNSNSSIVFGNGDAATITGTINFETGYQQLDSLVLNTPGSTFTLGTTDTIAELIVNITNELNSSAYNLAVTGNTVLSGTFIDNNNGGTNSFLGKLTVNPGASFSTANNSPFVFGGGITNNGTFSKAGTGAVTFINNQDIDGSNQLDFTGGNITISAGDTVTNDNAGGIRMDGILNGADATATWAQSSDRVLDYRSATTPMATGILDASATGNIVNYNLNNNQNIKGTTYSNLQFSSAGTKNLQGAITVNGTFTTSGTANTSAGTNNITFNDSVSFTSSGTFTTGADTVRYNRNGNQDVISGTYAGVVITGGSGIKTSQGNSSITGNLFINNNSTLTLDGDTLTTSGNISIENGGTLDIDDNAQLLIANGRTLTNDGILRIVGTSGNEASVIINGAGSYSINQSAATGVFHAQYYNIANGSITISAGSIDNTNNFSNGVFTSGTGSEYVNLTGCDITGLPDVDNVQFDNGPTYNVTRTSGTGSMTFTDASGNLSGESFDQDDSNPGTLVLWTYPSSTFYSKSDGMCAGNPSNWARNQDGSGPSPASVSDGLATLIVQDGHTVTLTSGCGNLDVNELIIGEGTSGVFIIGDDGTQVTATVRSLFHVQTGANVSVGSSGSPSHLLQLYGNLENEGTFNLRSTGANICNTEVYAPEALIIGPVNPRFNSITVKTGAVLRASDTLDVNANFTLETGATFNDGDLAHTIAGNWSEAGTGLRTGNGKIIFDGLVNTINNAAGTTVNFYDIEFRGGGAGSIQENITVDNNFSIDNLTSVSIPNYSNTINGDFIINVGSSYNQSANTTYFNGADTQNIILNGSNSFYNLTFNNGGVNPKIVTGNITTTADVLISSGATVEGSGDHNLAGDLGVNGICNFSGSITMSGTGYNDIIYTSNAGNSLTLGTAEIIITGQIYLGYNAPATADTVFVNNNVSVQSNILVIQDNTFLIDQSGTATFSAAAGTRVYCRGYDNFPDSFAVYTFDVLSAVEYDAAFDQIVSGGITYGEVELDNTGTKTADGNVDINGVLDLNAGITFDLQNFSHTFAGNIENGTNSSINGALANVSLDNPDNDQYISASGTGSYSFNNLTVTQSAPSFARTRTFYDGSTILINNNFTITNPSGSLGNSLTVDLNANSIGGTPNRLTMNAFTQLNTDLPSFSTGVSDNFSDTLLLDPASTIYYSLNGAQDIADGFAYGNLLVNGNTKTAEGALDINGNVSSGGNTPLWVDGGFTHTLAGNWTLGTANCLQANLNGTLILDGADQEISTTNLNNLTVNNSGTATLNGNLVLYGNLVIQNGATLNADIRDISIAGNWDNSGSGIYQQTAGTVTFNGVVNQTVASNAASPFLNITINKPNAAGLQTLTATTDLIISGNTTIANDAGVFDITGQTIYFGNDLTVYANVVEPGLNFISTNSNVLFDGAAEQRIYNWHASPLTFNNIEFTGAGEKMIGYRNDNGASPNIVVTGDWTITNATVNANGAWGGNISAVDIYVAGDWTNNGGNFTHQAARTVYFNGGDQNVSSSTFGSVDFAGTDTKTLTGNINATGNLTISTSSTLDANNNNITITGNWFDTASASVYLPGTGSVVFEGNATSYIYSGTDTGTTAGKSFYNLIISKNAGVNVYAVGDCDVNNDFQILSGNFRTDTFELWVAGDFENSGNFYQSAGSIVTLDGADTLNFSPNNASFRDFIIDAPGALYNVNNNFIVTGSTQMVVNDGIFKLNGNDISLTGNNTGITVNGGEFDLDAGAEIASANNNDTIYINGGVFKMVGTSAQNAVITRTGGNGINIKMSGGKIHANNYKYDLGRGITITNGTIDTTDNFSNGVFTSGTGNAYMTLTGFAFTDFNVTNTQFNTGPTYNVSRTTGSGVITFEDAFGTRAGEGYDQDDADPGSLILWTYPSGVYWDGEALTDQWDDPLNWTSNAVPDSNDLVYLDHSFVVGAYTVNIDSSDATCGRLTMDIQAGAAIDLQLRMDKDLQVEGNINIGTGATLTLADTSSVLYVAKSWTNNGTFNHGNSSVVFNGPAGTYSITTGGTGAGKIFYNLVIDANDTATYNLTQAMTVDSNFSILGGTLDAISGNYDITVGGDWLVDGTNGGIFVPQTADVTFNGANQSISGGNFYNVITSGSGTKTVLSNINIANDFTIGSGTTLDGQETTIYVGDDWTNNGSFTQTGFGAIAFDGTGGQLIDNGTSTTTFRNITMTNGGGKTFYNHSNVTGDFIISGGSGTVDVQDYLVSGTGTNNFIIAGGTTLQVRGANNFPDNFGSYSLANNSTVEYISAIDQTIKSSATWNYGNLRLDDLSGGITTKTAEGDLIVTGNVYIDDTSTVLDMATNDADMTLTGGIAMPTDGKQINWGTLTSTLTHVGDYWNIDGDITGFNNLILAGSGDKYMYGDLAITGDVTLRTGIDLMMYGGGTAAFHTMTGLAGKTFTLEGNSRVLCPIPATTGPAFATDFGNYNLSASSTVFMYSGDGVDQTLYTDNGIIYGNLYLRNVKNVTSDGIATLDVNGSFDEQYSTYIDNGQNISIAGVDIWLTNYTPSSSAIVLSFDGNTDQYLRDNINNNILIPALTVSGTGTKTLGDGNDVVSISGDLSNATTSTITSGRNITFSGSTWDNDGIFRHTGNTVTFNSNAAQSINPGPHNANNYFYNIAFDGSGSKTFNSYGLDVNYDFTLNSGMTVNLSNLNYIIGDDIINTVGGTLQSANASIKLDGGGQQDINTPSFEVDSITIAGTSTKLMYSNWIINDDLLIESGTLNTNNAGNYSINIKGNWENAGGTFVDNAAKVTFDGSGGNVYITSDGDNFYDVEFDPSGATHYYLLSPSTRIARTMDVRADATLDLNSQILILGSNIGAGKTYTIEGTLEADANSQLLFNNQNTQSIVNVDGTLRLLGDNDINVATLSREVAGVAGSETQVNILSGGTLEAKYYLIEYLQDAGLQMQAGSILHATNNFSNGTWSNIRAVANVAYLNLEANYAGDTIKNVCFNYSGTPTQGTHFNVRRNTAAGDIIFDNITGNLGSYLYEDDDEASPSATTGKLHWPGITLTNWTGAKDQNWHDPLNWDNGVPDAYMDATIPDRVNDPVITNGDAYCKNLTISDGSVVLDSDRKLFAGGDVIIGTLTNVGILSVATPASEIYCGGLWTKGTNGIFLHGNGTVIFNSGTGTATITPGTSNFYNVVFDNSSTNFYITGATINFLGDFDIQSGIVTPNTNTYTYNITGDFINYGTFVPNGGAVGSGTVNLNGSGDQTITRGYFYNVNVEGTGNKIVSDSMFITNNTVISSTLSADPGAYIDFNGNVTINSGGLFNDGGNTHYFSGTTWRGDGEYNGTGTMVFDKTNGNQNLYKSQFNNLDINCAGYRFYLWDSCSLYGNLTIRSTIQFAYLFDNIFYDTTGTNTFTLENAVRLYVLGDNFPKNFGIYDMHAGSRTLYYGISNQIIDGGISYGNLELNNANTKSLGGDIVVQGYLTLNNATLDVTANSYNIEVMGYWYNNSTGTFIPHQGEVKFTGSAYSDIQVAATATNPFYDLRVDKSLGATTRTNSNVTWSIEDDLYVDNGLFNNNGRTITVGGDLVATSGTFNNGGTYILTQDTGNAYIRTNSSVLNNITINSAGDATFTLQDNLTLNGNFTLTQGIFDADGKIVTLGNGLADVVSISGTYKMGEGGSLLLGDATSLTVNNSGRFEAIGTASEPVNISRRAGNRYGFLVNGEIAAKYYLFEYMNSTGIYLSNTSTIDTVNNFSFGTFTNGANSGCFLRVENTQSFTGSDSITDVSFPANPGGTAYNVRKISSGSGILEFYNSNGLFAGESYDDDPLNLVIWTGPVTLTWDGSESSDWFDPENWTASSGPAIVPTGNENVFIAVADNPPILDSANAKTANLTIEAGATLTLNTGAADSAMDLSVGGNLNINGILRLLSSNDSLSVQGSWIKAGGGTTLLNGNVFMDGLSGTEMINNGNSPFYNLYIMEPGSYQLASHTYITNDLYIDTNASLSSSGGNYNLTVGGDWLNYGTYTPFQSRVTLNASSGTLSLVTNGSSFYNLDINAGTSTYIITDSLKVDANLNIMAGTLDLNSNILKFGDNNGSDYLSISGTLNLDNNSTLRIGANANVEVNNGGTLKIVGGDETSPAKITRNNTGSYGITVKSGGELWARFYDISYTNANGILMQSGSTLNDNNNLSDGTFSNGFSTGTYITFQNEFGGDDTIRNVVFNTGPVYNVTRVTGADVVFFADATGGLGTYDYENDMGSPDPNLGLIRWPYLSTCVWTGTINTDWHTPGNWACGAVPDTSNNIIIPDVINDPIIDTALAECKNFTMYSGATLSIKQDLTVNGNFFYSGTISVTGSPTISVNQNWTSSGGSFNAGSSTVLFTAPSGTIDVTIESSNFYNLSLNSSSGAIVKPASNFVIINDVTIINGTFDFNGKNLTVGGSWINTGTFITGARTLTFNGAAGSHTINTGGSTFYNLVISSSTGAATYMAGSDISVLYNFTISKGTFDLSDDGGTTSHNLTINNRYTNSGGTVLGRNGTISVNENWITSGAGVFTAGTSTVRMTAPAGVRSITPRSNPFYNLTIDGTATFRISNSLIINNDLTINNGVLDVSTGPSYNIGLAGNWTNNGTFVPRTGMVNFNGNGQTLTKIGGETFYHLKVNNDSLIINGGDITAQNYLTMTAGNILLKGNSLTLGTSTLNPGTLSYTDGIIVGEFERWISSTGTDYIFPVGLDTALHTYTLYCNNGLTGGSVSVEYIPGDPGDAGLPVADGSVDIEEQFTEGYWTSSAKNSFACTNYNLALNATGFTSHTFNSNARIIKRTNGGNWTVDGNHSAAVPPVVNRTNMNGLATTSTQFAIAAIQCLGGSIGYSDTVCWKYDLPQFTNITPASGGTFTYTWQYTTDTNIVAGAPGWTDLPASNVLEYDFGEITEFVRFVRMAEGCPAPVYSNIIRIDMYRRPQTGRNYFINKWFNR